MAFQGLRRGLVNMNSADPKLTNLLHEEKDVLKELANLAREKAEAARFLTMWGNIEHADIKDICDRTRDLLNEFQNMLSDFSAGYGNYREKLKEIHKGGETLHDLKHKQSTLQSKLSQAIKNKKPHEQLQSELATTEREVLEHIANYESSKRALFRDALESQFEAFNVFGKQLVVLGTFGKYMAGQIPQGKLAPGQDLPMYKGNDTTRQIYSDFIKELKEAAAA
ncbi:lipid-binding protein [Polyrhizophydium stewartii]|uniref:Lipid-binding protein n=1 Tax=Polyrhizophydium stewartii TaxID=2732419 RepID=A0ABR4NG60_9FUNG